VSIDADMHETPGLLAVPPVNLDDPLEVRAAIIREKERIAEAETTIRRANLAAAVGELAPTYRIWDPAGVARLIPEGMLVFDSAGKPLNVRQALDLTVTAYPSVVGDPPRPPRPPAPPMPAARMRRLEESARKQRMMSRTPQ
jgi:hypothetical protein